MRGGDEEELLTDTLTVNVSGLVGRGTVRYAPPKPPVEFSDGAEIARVGMRTPSPFGWGTASDASSLSMASTGDVMAEAENQQSSINQRTGKKKKVRWTPDEEASTCELCHAKFNFLRASTTAAAAASWCAETVRTESSTLRRTAGGFACARFATSELRQ